MRSIAIGDDKTKIDDKFALDGLISRVVVISFIHCISGKRIKLAKEVIGGNKYYYEVL